MKPVGVPDSERRALLDYATQIERYEADLRQEWKRLEQPFAERIERLMHKTRSHSGPRDQVSRPGCHYLGGSYRHHRELLYIRIRVVASLNEYAARHRPAVKIKPLKPDAPPVAWEESGPLSNYDTPARLVAWIDERLVWIGGLKRKLLEYTETGRKVVRRQPDRFPPPRVEGVTAYPKEESLDLYRGAICRTRAFSVIAPTITDLLLSTSADPIIGLWQIRDLFAGLAAPRPEAAPPEPDRDSESPSSPRTETTAGFRDGNADRPREEEVWITAKDALAEAMKHGIVLKLGDISKKGALGEFRTKQEQIGRSRRQVELGSFRRWLHSRARDSQFIIADGSGS